MSERLIILHLKENFRLAAEDCERLAKGERGPIYLQFRRRLKTAEKSCREIGSLRGDARWLQVGLRVAAAQAKCGDFLRSKQPGWRFAGLAQILRQGERSADNLAHRATNRVGLILPKAPEQHRETRPVGVILPPGFKPSTNNNHPSSNDNAG